MTALMAFQYAVGDIAARKQADAWSQCLLADAAWTEHVNRRGLRLLIRTCPADAEPIILGDDGGIVLGILFEKSDGGDRRVRAVSEADARRWCASDLKELIGRCWGPYLAVLCDRARDRVLILRDPIGARAAYVVEQTGVRVLFTEAADWAKLSAIEIDEGFLRIFLANPRSSGARTAIRNVAEILPGHLYVWERGCTRRQMIWSPSPSEGSATFAEFDWAVPALAHAARRAGAAWASVGLPIVHRLSGGFDSSAALATLMAGGARQIVCMNERALCAPEADEYEAATRAAAHFGLAVEEIRCDPAAADYRGLLHARTSPAPSLADMSFADKAALSIFRSAPPVLLTSGQGGDQVFSRRPLLDALADAVRDGRDWRELMQIALGAARLSGKPLIDILRAAGLALTQSQRRTLAEALANAEGASSTAHAEALAIALDHPWIADIDHRGPARTLRAHNLADLNFYQRSTLLSDFSIAAPIFAMQPVVETVLAIPPYLMQANGRDRSLARAAFADLLPAGVLNRTRKGDTTRHFVRAVHANLSYLRALLSDGELVQRGLIERAKLDADLDKPEGGALFRLITACVGESWMLRIKALTCAARAC